MIATEDSILLCSFLQGRMALEGDSVLEKLFRRAISE
jgi:hypothetical protein